GRDAGRRTLGDACGDRDEPCGARVGGVRARGLVSNLQSRRRAFKVGEKHYDLGNDLYREMLDRRMIYSCAYWKNARNLEEAQEAKLELVCKKLELSPGLKVLDIGCGWGGFAIYAAERYGAEVVGVTISREQFNFAQE